MATVQESMDQLLTESQIPDEQFSRILLAITADCQADYGRLLLSTQMVDAPHAVYHCVHGQSVETVGTPSWLDRHIAMHRAPMFTASPTPYPFFTDTLELPGPVQVLAAPIIQEGRLRGVISLGFTQCRPFDGQIIDTLTSLANQLAVRLPIAPALTWLSYHVIDWEQISLPVLVIDQQERVVAVNSPAVALLRRSAGEVMGRLLEEFLQPDAGLLFSERSSTGTVTLPDGSQLRTGIFCATVFRDDEQPLLALVLQDLWQESASLAEKLKLAELEGITRTIATVNHEINNPLFGLMTTAQLLSHEWKDAPPAVTKKFERIGECCERIRLIVDKLSQVIQPARRTYVADEGMLDLPRATWDAITRRKPQE